MPASTAGANNSDKDDPVYAQSTFLTSYMSNHTDVLVAYILNESLQQQQRKEKKGKGASTKKDEDAAPVSADAIKEPRMMKITSREMVLEYKDAKAGKAIRTVSRGDPGTAGVILHFLQDDVRTHPDVCASLLAYPVGIQVTVPFDPPLLAYDEVRPRLTQMKLEAEANIGMVRHPSTLYTRCNGSYQGRFAGQDPSSPCIPAAEPPNDCHFDDNDNAMALMCYHRRSLQCLQRYQELLRGLVGHQSYWHVHRKVSSLFLRHDCQPVSVH